ncbi:MAG TPA: hypothetical protein VK430_09635 [Xanthobacteraceae bacterium]|nr:hypothetical protein [Xanthobacteraceae bacterium]
MWAITSYFNPARYKRRLQNYRTFRTKLAAPLVTMELSFDGNFELKDGDADILIQISGGAIVWQKERLLNLAIRSVPSDVDNIAWIDCDVIFERSDWPDEAEAQLDNFEVVQLFSELVDLKSEYGKNDVDYRDPVRRLSGLVSLINDRKIRHSDVGPLLQGGQRDATGFSMGIAWAARRKVLEGHGLYDAMIIGGGTRALIGTLYGQFQKIIEVFELNSARQAHYLKWARPYYEAVGDRVGHVPGRIYHLWHGDRANRKILERHHMLAGFDFAPDADLTIGANGAWQWARSRPDLEQLMTSYFDSRAEDG